MPSTRLTAAAMTSVAAFALGAVATAAAPTAAASVSAFYQAPGSVPNTPGTLIKSERFFGGINVSGNPTRIMYSSKDDSGKPVAVTGTYIEPRARWNGPGDRPVVTFTVGTIGQGDQCAPSKLMASAIGFGTFGSLPVNYEGLAINGLLAKGVAVVVTDYIGLGMNDRPHTYMNRLDQGHAALDAARAASKVPGATVTPNSKVATYGYSQGGGASGAALELASSYAPELKMAAGYVGAPPANLEQVLAGIDKSPIVGVVGYFINGAAAQHPIFKDLVDANVNETGRRFLDVVSRQCSVDTVFTSGYQSTSKWTKTGETLSQVMNRTPEVLAFVRAQKLGTVAPTVPVRLGTGITDDIVPHDQARQVGVDWCARGAKVTYAPIANPSTGPKSILNHATPLLLDQSAAITFVADQLAGKSATNSCGQIASMR